MSHSRHAATTSRRSRWRLLVVLAAPVTVLASLTATAATAPVGWARTWSPAVALLSNYNTAHSSPAGFLALPLSMHTLAGQTAVATATFKTNWVDVNALVDGPNIVQQGLSIEPAQFKLQIMHGSTPASHRGNCHIKGTTGEVLAFGPAIDVADGNWHTITCIKNPDTASGTKVLVIVDGVAGKAQWSHTPIGNIQPTGLLRLGGRSALASTDSLDGWISAIGFSLS